MMPREHEFRSEVFWENDNSKSNSNDFLYHFQDRGNLNGSSAVPFKGNGERVSPEELFITSISACQMLTYLHLCSKNGINVLSYRDEAKGFLSMTPGDKTFIKQIYLYPVIICKDVQNDLQKAIAIRLIHEAHELCFLTSSIVTEIIIEPNFVFRVL
ncbi:MAG: OsmC family protein [Spirochaetia bacterium]|nr:OsmC family protein [Spirochaetia bacterium]